MKRTSAERSESDILRWAAEWPGALRLEQLTPTILRNLTLVEGCDAAVAVLYDRIRRSERHRRLIEWMDSQAPLPVQPRVPSTVVVVPPLYDEKDMEYPSSGRFAVKLAAEAGFPTHWLPVPSIRTVDEGSEQVRDYLMQQSAPVIVISLSRSTLDVKFALATMSPEEQLGSLRGWLSITGIPKGTPVINALRERLVRRTLFHWFIRRHKWNEQAFLDLIHGPGTRSWPPTRIATGIPIVHIPAFPLRRHFEPAVTNKSEQGWVRMIRAIRLDRYGPNEGAALLSDLLEEPGEVYPVWGVPHWIGPPWNIEDRLKRALHYIDAHA